MFSVAYVVLPPVGYAARRGDPCLARAVRTGARGDLLKSWLAFDDETAVLRTVHAATLTFTDDGRHGLRVEGGDDAALWFLDGRDATYRARCQPLSPT